jgi:glycosyltransferase involved in cell wall biosynthesis
MQRVRMSLPYFKQFGWDAEVVTVDENYINLQKDELLLKTVPADIEIHTVKALNKTWTSKLGFGGLAYRSCWFYFKKVNSILRHQKYDLVYFSTTEFPICVLGAYWKKRFGVPYVIDMQDPWFSDYYKHKPKQQQPPKYRLVYALHKRLEARAMAAVDGLISVSDNYIADLKNRYPKISNVPATTITFAGSKTDIDIALDNKDKFADILTSGFKNLVYAGRGGVDLHQSITPVFSALSQLLTEQPDKFRDIKLYFLGTSYAPKGEGTQTILPLAHIWGVADNVIEVTDRISYFNTLAVLQQADALFIPGSDDPAYTASKIYPYLLSEKPLLTIFHPLSPAAAVFEECGLTYNYSYDDTDIKPGIKNFLAALANDQLSIPRYNDQCLQKYSALTMTANQCRLFEEVIANHVR